jgi:DNA-binding GntR family transcriptional regulator
VPPNQSAVVRPFGPRQLFEIYHLRALLEIAATRLACARFPREKLQAVAAENKSLLQQGRVSPDQEWVHAAIESDRKLHQQIAAHCGSDRLAHEIDRYSKLMLVISNVTGNKHHALVDAMWDHRQIIDALVAGDAESAAKRMGEHIHNAAIRDINAIYGAQATESLFNPALTHQATTRFDDHLRQLPPASSES